MSTAARSNRLHYVDALRIAAIAIVFVVHVAEVFNPWDEWHISNGVRSRIIGELAVLAAPWVMPLLMLLAGVSASYALRTRSNAAYVRDRVSRLLIPLLIGTLVLVPPQVYLERRLRGQFFGSFREFYPRFFVGIYPQGNFSWHHLWFLGHLFAYSLLALPLFRYWQRGGDAALGFTKRLSTLPAAIFWLGLPLVVERNALWWFFPERHMLASDWSNHAMLLVAYIYGFLLVETPWFGEALDRQRYLALVIALVGSLILVAGTWSGALPARIPPPYSLNYLMFWMLYAVCAWAWIATLIAFGRRRLVSDSGWIAYGRQFGYSIYLLHQPIIVALAFVIVQWSAAVATKFLVLLGLSATFTVIGAELLARASLAQVLLGVPSRRFSRQLS